jgi:thioredoxin family protein
MPIQNTVVTATRYDEGLIYADFLSQALVNRDKFEMYYKSSPLSDDDVSFFRKAAAVPPGPAKILALAEAWCGDVYRELPTVVRIAESTGMSLRIFLRDENPDIMDEFLSHGGKARAIPVFVFYSSDMQYITHFTERPASANAELTVIMNEVKSRLNLPQAATFTTMPNEGREEIIRRILPRFVEWQKDSITEMRQILASALNLPER